MDAQPWNQGEQSPPAPEAGEILEGRLEMAHVLYLDLVGYSKLSMEEQRKTLLDLQRLMRATTTFVRSEASKELIALPTGDGMALVFFGDPTSAAQCAIEISQATRSSPAANLRMGLHVGPVYRIADINKNSNISGGGINVAQRVMDAGNAGHILLSANVADVLRQLDSWKGHLTDFGVHEVKHGEQIHFFNLCTGDAGNSAWPTRWPKPERGLAWLRPTRRKLAVGFAAAVLAVGYGLYYERSAPLTKTEFEYWITVQRYKDGRPYRQAFQLANEVVFEEDFRIAVNVTAPKPGFLYVLNEGPLPDGSTSFNVLYPSPGKTARVPAGEAVRLPSEEWFFFDRQAGSEKLSLIWSVSAMPDLEVLKERKDFSIDGVVVIREPAPMVALRRLLEQYQIPPSKILRDETLNKTILTSQNETLVHTIRMEHH
jgi:class 3 adenylate cyclase